MEAIVYICLGLTLIFGVMAVMLRSLIKATIALGAASATLGIIMFELGSLWSALFEVSVCSGLVTVVFVSAISLSNSDKQSVREQYSDKKRMALLPLFLILAGVLLVIFAIRNGVALPAAAPVAVTDSFREIFWNQRQVDIWGQIIIVLTGATSVVVLFRESE